MNTTRLAGSAVATAVFTLLMLVPHSPGSEQLHRIAAGALDVEVATDTRRLEQVYGPRFDRSAVVVGVRWKGRSFVEERGLPDEFGLRGMGVLGYEEAAPDGGEFLKIGVGVLRRDTPDAYTFARHWPVASSLPVETEVTATEVRVRQSAPELQGFSVETEKRYHVQADGVLVIEYGLRNTGRRPIAFEHYNHNFFAFAGVPTDEAYRVVPAFALPESSNEPWLLDADGLRLRAPAPARAGVSFAVEVQASPDQNLVIVRHRNGQRVEIGGDFPVARFVVWATAPVICPEVFHRATVQPDETVRWTRWYRFSSS
jgi:hypothetical protein